MPRAFRHALSLAVAFATVALLAPSAEARPTAGQPLAEILDLAKPYPNLLVEVRLQLLRAGLKREQVSCASERLDGAWTALANRRTAPYACPIGKRTLHIQATPQYYDSKGRRLELRDKELAGKAARLTETHWKWQWR